MGVSEATEKAIQNIRSMTGGTRGMASNAPSAYASRQKRYFDEATSLFIRQYAKYASDYVSARVQGLLQDDFYAWTTQTIRMADVITAKSANTRMMDDHKIILFDNPAIGYMPPGAKLETMGSTWLSVNPQNISSPVAGGLVRRCNAVWKHLDFYGNILSEPLIVNKSTALANDNDEQDIVLITKGYFDMTVQYNDQTAQLKQNSRLILGAAAYAITGYSAFTQEFTDDYNSVHLLNFTLRYEEPNDTDDMLNRVAGGKAFRWDITIAGTGTIINGMTTQLTAESKRNGTSVTTTEQNPISYVWSSDRLDVATVDATGLVTAIAPGTCVITAALEQNPDITATFVITVEEAESGETAVRFASTIPSMLTPYTAIRLTAEVIAGGEVTQDIVKWTFGGADTSAYTTEVDGNTVTIRCWQGSVKPLQVTASYGETMDTARIELRGI